VFTTVWTTPLDESPLGLLHQREAGGLVVWGERGGLTALSRRGTVQARTRFPEPPRVAVADDGSAVVAATADQLSWLAPEQQARWQRSIPSPATAVALDPFGRFLAVADGQSRLEILDRDGRRVLTAECPRPFRHLVFVPAAPALIAAADFGLLARLELPSGEWAWRASVVAHVGGLAVADSGEPVVLACYSAGLRRFSAAGKPVPTPDLPGQSVAVTFDGRLTVVLGPDDTLTGLNPLAEVVFAGTVDEPVRAMALAALGDTAFVATVGGAVRALAVPGQ
jgi:hypothetical protein